MILLSDAAARFALAVVASALCGSLAAADPPPLWPCGSRSGTDLIFSKGVKRDADGKIIPRKPDAPRAPFPRGGSYLYGGAAANLTFAAGTVWRIGPFDVVCHAIILDGQPLHPDRRWFEPQLIEFEGSTALIWRDETAIILRGIPIAWWRRGASRQIHGTAHDDILTGTEGADVIVSGSGSDLVRPGGGNDAIVFTSGALVIADDPPNNGVDHVELTRFRVDDLAFTADGTDLIISTPDGYIRVLNQLATVGGQLENVRLSDGKEDVWVDAKAMRDFAKGQ